MSPPFSRVALALVIHAAAAQAQSAPPRFPVHVTGGAGYLTSGAYFAGPGALGFGSGDAVAGVLQVSLSVHPSFSVVLAGTYARPDWRLSGVPIIRSVGVDGAGLWFVDAAIRGQLPLGGRERSGLVAFAQAGPGLAHYAINTAVLGARLDESATNFALAIGAGLDVPLTSRVSLELMAKDYIASFKSVTDFTDLGVQGRRAHTLVLGGSGRIRL